MTVRLLCCALLFGIQCVRAQGSAGVPGAVLDLAMEPAAINTAPGPEYSDEQRDFAMVIGMDRTRKGRIWAAWVAGGDSDKGYFVAASSDDDGTTWSKPRLVIHPPAAPIGLRRRVLVGNFWCDPGGRMWLFYDQSMGYFDGRAGVWAITCENPDADQPVWSAPRRIWHGATLNKPIVLKNGDWLLPISLWTRDRIKPQELRDGFLELDEQRMANIFVSIDQGATWTRRGGVVIPESSFDEHMFVELKDGRLWMLARTKQGISETYSLDRGRTWSEPKPSAIQNPSARFFLRRLGSGHLLLVKNGPLDKRIGRSQMMAFVSDDEGKSWKGGLMLDERNGVSYPDGFQSPDGVIHIIHDRERTKEREILMARFTEEDVLAAKFIQAGSQSKMLVSKALGPRIGDVIYNGIQLPGEWPPKFKLSRKPLAVPSYLSTPPNVIPIDVGRQLFVDDFLIEQTTMRRVNHQPEYFSGNPVLKPEHPWEAEHAAPFSDGVCFDQADRRFKMWYWARGDWEGKTIASTCLATSRDGIRWEKPVFDVVPGTNIVLPDEPDQTRNSATAWLDHDEKDRARRFKMFRVVHVPGKDGWRIRMSVSPDGIHWSTADESDKVGDRTTVFYNALRKVWVASIRSSGSEHERVRHYHEGRDAGAALHWQATDGKHNDVSWVGADELDPDRSDLNLRRLPERRGDLTSSQLYNLDCVAYESVLLGLFSIWRGQQVTPLPKINEICVGYSRDGFHWSRPDRRAFCPVAANENVWNSGNLQSAGGCCLVVGDKLHFYVGAVPKGSAFADPGNVGLATLRRDGFVSMDAGETSATLTTRKVAFNGTHLFVNMDCPQGELRVEVLDEIGKVVSPFTKENCEPIAADKTRRAVRWKGAPDLSAMAGKAAKFRFHLTNGKLYAFWVSSDESGASHGYGGAGGPGFDGAIDDKPADIIVYGGTSGGVIAAVKAARLGKKTILIEPGRHLGGMSSGGLGMTDNGSTETIGGLAREFYQRVYLYYTKPDAWKQQKREDFLTWLPKIWGVDGPRMEEIRAQFIFEPHAAEIVFNDMAREAGVQVVLGERLDLKDGVRKDGARITRIVMESGREFTARVFIDSSYEGDLMAKAGVKYIVGREPNSLYGETLNGAFPFTPAPFPKISPYVVAGDPASGLLPGIEPKPPGPKGTGDHRVQTYNFRLCLTDVEGNRVPLTKPANYNSLNYELLARHIATMKNVKPGPRKHAAIGLRGNGGDLGINFELVPNRKTDSNCGSEFGSDFVGHSYGWADGDYATRERLWQEHKDYTLGLLWFLGHDERLPIEVRAEMQRWGLPKDEFTDNEHFPHQLYVREARRMVGDYVVTENDARGTRVADDPVALASYPLDSHGVTLYVDENGLLHRERGFFTGTKPFPISYKALRPRAGECDNLLVLSCLSASHAAYGSVRMEPVFMMLGHAAGAAASLAIDRDVNVQNVPYAPLRLELLSDKQILDRDASRPVSAANPAIQPEPASPLAPNAQLIADVNVLVEKKVVDSGDYWLAHARKGAACDGALVEAMVFNMAKPFELATNRADALRILAAHKVLSSPVYWEEHAAAGYQCAGDNVRAIIRNFVRAAR